MCKKLTKLVLESEAAREELAKYRCIYGDLDPNQSPEGRQSYTHAREAEVKVHLKLVEEEATLLSRRIVELEVENRGLRAEMGDLREKVGRWAAEAEDEAANQEEVLPPQATEVDGGPKKGRTLNMQAHDRQEGKVDVELCNPAEVAANTCHMTREGPVGGERASSASPESGHHDNNPGQAPKTFTVKDYECLRALRDHSYILSSAVHLLMAPPKNGHCLSPSEVELNGKAEKMFSPGQLNEALELLQSMLVAFIERLETFLGEDVDHNGGRVKDPVGSLRLNLDCAALVPDAVQGHDGAEDLRTSEVKERQNLMQRCGFPQLDHVHSSGDSKIRLLLQILRLLHQWFQLQGAQKKQVNVEYCWFIFEFLFWI